MNACFKNFMAIHPADIFIYKPMLLHVACHKKKKKKKAVDTLLEKLFINPV